MCNNFIVL